MRAAARGGARGTSRRSSDRARGPTSSAAMTSSSSSAASALEVEIRVRELEHVLGLRAREAERREVPRPQLLDPLSRRELPGDVVLHAVGADEVPTNRRGSAKRDLLRRDGDDERLERLRVERRAGSRRAPPRSARAPARPPPRPGRPRDRTGHRAAARPRAATPRLHGSTSTPPVAAVTRTSCRRDDAMEAALVEHGRAVRPEVAEPRGRELEVVRLRYLEQQAEDVTRRRAHARRRGSRRTRSNGTRPAAPGTSASPSRAKTRVAACATQRSE